MKLHTLSSRASARGLTLIELVVVLAILVALAGLIIGNFPSLLKKASGSTSANTIQDIGRAMSIRYTTKGSYPSGFDNLALASLPTNALAQLEVGVAISATDAGVLTNLGLIQVVNLMPYPATAPDATWSVSDVTNLVSIVGANVAQVTNTTLINKLVPNTAGYTGTLRIYVFGVGKVCTLVGGDSTLLEAPTRTGTSEQDASSTFYQRYCVAFLVDGASAATRKGRFIGVVAPTATGFEVTDDATKTYQTN